MSRSPRTLRLEQLESRNLMTAVVSPVTGGVVEITGGNGAESVLIRQLDLNSFKVKGDVAGGAVRLDGVARFEIALNGGDDRLTFNGNPIKDPEGGFKRALVGGLDVDMGGGSDTVRFRVMDIEGHVDIHGQQGADDSEVVTIRDSYWGGGADIQTGDGADQVLIDRGARLRGVVNIDTGFSDADVDDSVFLANSEFGRLTLDMHGGNDELEMVFNNFNADAFFNGGDGDGDVAGIRGNDFKADVDFESFEAIVRAKPPKVV